MPTLRSKLNESKAADDDDLGFVEDFFSSCDADVGGKKGVIWKE